MARSFCKTNIRKALRKSWDNHGTVESVNDDWRVCIHRAYSWLGVPPMASYTVTVWQLSTGYRDEFSVGGCTSMTEYLDYTTTCIMRHLTVKATA